MQCQRPYVFINKDIYTRISICTFYIIIYIVLYILFKHSIGLNSKILTLLPPTHTYNHYKINPSSSPSFYFFHYEQILIPLLLTFDEIFLV